MDSTYSRTKNGISNSDRRDGNAIVRRKPPPTMMKILKTTSSTLDTIMFAWRIIRQYCPHSILHYLHRFSGKFFNYVDPYPYIQISFYEFSSSRLHRSKAFPAIEAYLSSKFSDDAKRLKADVDKSKNNFLLSMDKYETVTGEYGEAEVWWTLSKVDKRRFYELKFHKKHRELVQKSYLSHVLKEGKEIIVNRRRMKLYTNGFGVRTFHQEWIQVYFEHPANFDTIAMDTEKKREIIEDLLTFSQSKDYYARIGKAWKRGYLLYGPPGTGKSTMIAAMANLMNYDIYDLELTAVKDNTELRKLLIETTSKSIIVIEDIDCSLELTGHRKMKKEGSWKDEEKEKENKKEGSSKEKEKDFMKSRVTLSGLLNFIDGLWSACGGERLIVFTTNHVEKLDPALIRRGRMDKHIELSYCGFEGFKVLAKNYLNVETHQLFEKIQELIKDVKVTPADVAENLMPKSRQEVVESSFLRLIGSLEELKRAAEENERKKEAKIAKKSQDSEIVK